MSETRYIISDAAKIINVEPHVLRYWEEELGMDIPRNEMGHRYYTDKEVRLFSQVRDLKEKGFQLKAIKMILSTVSEDAPASNIISLDKVRTGYGKDMPDMAEREIHEVKAVEKDKPLCADEMDAVSEDKVPVDMEAIREAGLSVADAAAVSAISAEDKMKHFKYIMDGIVMQALKKNNQIIEEQVTGKVIKEMDYMFRVQEEKDEERFRNLDDAIRKKQKGRKEAAAARAPGYTNQRQKKRLFGRKDMF